MIRIVVVLFLALAVVPVGSGSTLDLWNEANSAYDKGDYERAIQSYLSLIDGGMISGELFYNVGNAFYKAGKIGAAIGYYRMALKINPSLTVCEENLRFVRNQVVDKVELQPRGILHDIWFAVVSFQRADFYLVTSAILFWFSIAVLSLIMLAARYKRRLIYLLIISGSLLIMTSVVTASAIRQEQRQRPGVIVVPSVELLEGPGKEFGKLFTCHDGLEFNIMSLRQGYYLVELANGLKGWIPADALMEIRF